MSEKVLLIFLILLVWPPVLLLLFCLKRCFLRLITAFESNEAMTQHNRHHRGTSEVQITFPVDLQVPQSPVSFQHRHFQPYPQHILEHCVNSTPYYSLLPPQTTENTVNMPPVGDAPPAYSDLFKS